MHMLNLCIQLAARQKVNTILLNCSDKIEVISNLWTTIMFSFGKVAVAVALFSVIVSYFYVLNIGRSAVSMANSGLLFVAQITKVQDALTKVSKYLQKMLYIQVSNGDNNLSVMSRQIESIYTKATSKCKNLDVRLILKPNSKEISTNQPIDVLLYDNALMDDIKNLKESVKNAKVDCSLRGIDLEDTEVTACVEPVKTYEHVVLGGTFDRLHNGHKILLSQAVLRTTKRLTVGVTDVNMIQSKKLYELIEPVEARVKSVLDFLTDINPDISYSVLPIQDVYGPTKDDPTMEMIVASEETERGVNKVNTLRGEKNLPLLDRYIIRLAPEERNSDEEEGKVSSSNKRMRLLGTLLRPPKPNPDIPKWPYIIGLSGGIAAGKSSIAEKLQAKGAFIVNCDIIAHELYAPGLPLNSTIAEHFSKDVIMENGEVDRRRLGQLVFGDPSQLEKLNSLVWPAVINEAERRARSSGARVVVLEAAVMLRAGWHSRVHQLWSVIIPREEAIKRLQTRNNLTEEEACQRIDSQPSNLEQVAPANVVFSPYWSYEYTQSQVDKAWDTLQEILRDRTPNSRI